MAGTRPVTAANRPAPGRFATVLLDNFYPLDNDQLRQSDGVRLVSKAEQKRAFYLEKSCVPAGPWEVVTNQICIWQTDLVLPNPRNVVGLFNLAPSLRQELGQFMARYRNAPPLALVTNSPIVPIRKMVRDYLYQRFALNDMRPDFDSLGFNSPHLPTTTIDRKIGLKIGLHYDSWYGPTASDKRGDYFRLVVNIGPAPRWFLFAPIPFDDFFALWADHCGVKEQAEMVPVEAISPVLLKMNPRIQCLKINPGQGYIAATESIIHDATTEWADQSNIHYQLLGKFLYQINAVAAFPSEY